MKPKANKPAPVYAPPKLTIVGSVLDLAETASGFLCGGAPCVRPVEPCPGPEPGGCPLMRH